MKMNNRQNGDGGNEVGEGRVDGSGGRVRRGGGEGGKMGERGERGRMGIIGCG